MTTMNSFGVLNLDLMIMEKNVSVEKTRASLFNYKLDHLFFVVPAEQFLIQEK